MRFRKLRMFMVVLVATVLVAAFGLALLRTYVFKPPPQSSGIPAPLASIMPDQPHMADHA